MARLNIKPSLILFLTLVIMILTANSEYGEDSYPPLPNRPVYTSPQRNQFNEQMLSGQIQDPQFQVGPEDDQFPPAGQRIVSPPYQISQPHHKIPGMEQQWSLEGGYPTRVISNQQYQQRHQYEQLRRNEGHPKTKPKPKATVKKKECGFPIMTRRLFGPVMKRAPHFADSEDEVQAKIKAEDELLEYDEIANNSFRVKRNELTEAHSGGCMAKRQWIDMGPDYYPRYVKSYHCSSNTCDRGFGALGECKPKHYTTKVLKRITPTDSTSVEPLCDHTLPDTLRVDWKLVSVTVTTCCDCVL